MAEGGRTRWHADLSWGCGVGRDGKVAMYMYRPPDVNSPIHTISLKVRGSYPRVSSVGFEAWRQESGTALSTRLRYSGLIYVEFVGIELDGLDAPINLCFPILFPTQVIEYEGVVQEFEFELKRKEPYLAKWRRLTSVLSSAEVLRDAMLSDLETYKAHVIATLSSSRTSVPSETRTYRKAKAMRLWEDGRQLRNLEYGEDMPAPAITGAKERERARRLIVGRIKRKRTYVRDNFKTLFETSQKTFPVAEWIAEEG